MEQLKTHLEKLTKERENLHTQYLELSKTIEKDIITGCPC